jgi:hypothetical protein
MKKTIQSFFLLSFLSVFALTSCNNYGKKVAIEGTKGEVYYKGEGVTESDAKKLGEFLKTSGFLSGDKPASIQLSKVGERYLVRFVYNKEYYEKNEGLDKFFQSFGLQMSKKIFNGSKVDIALSDKSFNDFKSIPYSETAANKEENPVINPENNPVKENTSFNKDDFEHDTQGGVEFFWKKDIPDQESKTIADYIVKNGAFSGGTAEIYMIKEGDRYILKFPVKADYRNDIATINEIEKVSKQIKENVFPNTPYSFQMTDEQLTSLKSFDY